MARRVLVLERGTCLEVERGGLHNSTCEVFISIIKVNSAHQYQVRIERSASANCPADHATFNLSEATILVPGAQSGGATQCNTGRELWSFTEGFSEERLIEVTGEVLANLRNYYAKCDKKASLEIGPTQFYSQSSKVASITSKKNERVDFGIFRIFPRQELAFRYFDDLFAEQYNLNKRFNLKIFSFEAPRTGQRKFLVADYDTFFRSYVVSNVDVNTSQKNGGDFSNHRGRPIVRNENRHPKNLSNSTADENHSKKSNDDNNTARVDRKNSADTSARLEPQKHVYEIIRENTPCRAYFDLEYQKEYNTEINGNILTAMWINLVVWKLSELYGINLNNDNIVVLDSSTDKKYSKHVIIIISNYSYPSFSSLSSSLFKTSTESLYIEGSENIMELSETAHGKEILFRNNIAVGALVNLIMRDITEIASKSEVNDTDDSSKMSNNVNTPHDHISTNSNKSEDSQNSNERNANNKLIKLRADSSTDSYSQSSENQRIPKAAYDKLWVNKENGKKVCFVDLGVYTKNRAFRLWNSSKFGKNVPFLILAEDRKQYRGLKFTENHKKEDQYKAYGQDADNSNNNIIGIKQLQDFTLKRSLIVPFDLFSDTNFSSENNEENIGGLPRPICTYVASKSFNIHSDVNNNINNDISNDINNNINHNVNNNINNNINNDMLGKEFIGLSREHSLSNIESVALAIEDDSISILRDTQKRLRDEFKTMGRYPILPQNDVKSYSNNANRNDHDVENRIVVEGLNHIDGCHNMKKKKVEIDVSSDNHTLLLFPSSLLPADQNLVSPRSLSEESEGKQLHSICDIFDSQSRFTCKYFPFLELSSFNYEKQINNFIGSSDGKYNQNGGSNYRKSWKNNEILSSKTCSISSPFPNVDKFVYHFVVKGGVRGILGKNMKKSDFFSKFYLRKIFRFFSN